MLAGLIWAIEHPAARHRRAGGDRFRAHSRDRRPYLGDVVGVCGDWTPLRDRGRLFPEDLDRDDPWQFKNIRVV